MKQSLSSHQLALAIDQANQALRVAIRTAYLTRNIPLDTTYEVKALPTPADQSDTLFMREVWVYPASPLEPAFRLLTETLQLITTDNGTELEQTIQEE